MSDNKNLNINDKTSAADISSAALEKNNINNENTKVCAEKTDGVSEEKAGGAEKAGGTSENKKVGEDKKGADDKKSSESKNGGSKNVGASALKSEYPTGKPKDSEGKKPKKGIIISYSVCAGLGLICAFLIAYSREVFSGKISGNKLFGALSDAFFVPGVLLAGFGSLIKIAEGGFFDGIAFGLKRAALSFIPGARLKKEENYAQYKERKEKNRKHVELAAPLIVGIAFVVIGAFFLIFYSSDSQSAFLQSGVSLFYI